MNADPKTLLDDLHPARFLKPNDLLQRWNVQSLTVTISRIAIEETVPNPKDVDPATTKPRKVQQPVLYFKTRTGAEFPRGFLISAKVDIQSLKTATGVLTAGDCVGKRITIVVGEHRGQVVLRISPHAPEEVK